MLPTSDVPAREPNESDRLSSLTATFTHPDDVLQSRALSLADKRAVLADWASDLHAVPDRPALRQLDSGAVVTIDVVLAALRALDTAERQQPGPAPSGKARVFPMAKWLRPLRARDRDGDDDPPPCPCAALPPGVELELRRRRDQAWGLAAA